MYLLNVYSIFKVREVFALTNQLGIFFRFVRSFFEIFQKNFFDHLSGIKKAPITSQRCNRGRNRKSPLTEISGLKSYEIIVCYRNLSAIAKFQTHFWRKLGVNWRKLWRKHRQFRGQSIELCACRNVRIDHQQMQLFFTVFVMHG